MTWQKKCLTLENINTLFAFFTSPINSFLESHTGIFFFSILNHLNNGQIWKIQLPYKRNNVLIPLSQNNNILILCYSQKRHKRNATANKQIKYVLVLLLEKKNKLEGFFVVPIHNFQAYIRTGSIQRKITWFETIMRYLNINKPFRPSLYVFCMTRTRWSWRS